LIGQKMTSDAGCGPIISDDFGRRQPLFSKIALVVDLLDNLVAIGFQ
jgi:hypothetical protein